MIEITAGERKIILDILERYVPDREVWVFGSRVRGRAKSYSDIDLVVIGTDRMTINQLGALREAFQESELPFRVDLLDWHGISPEFRKVIEEKHEKLKGV